MLRCFYTILKIKRQCKKLSFLLFGLKTLLILNIGSQKLVWTWIRMPLVCSKNIMKIAKFLSTHDLKNRLKTIFSSKIEFIFNRLQPNSWSIRMKFLLNNIKYVYLLHGKYLENQSTLGLKNGVPNSKKSFLKCKISTFGWWHLKTAQGQ